MVVLKITLLTSSNNKLKDFVDLETLTSPKFFASLLIRLN